MGSWKPKHRIKAEKRFKKKLIERSWSSYAKNLAGMMRSFIYGK